MDNKLQIIKGLSDEVIALMADWQEISGHFYLGDQAQNHYGKETLLDVLNNPDKNFVPFKSDEDTPMVLIQKSRIVGLHPANSEIVQWLKNQECDKDCWKSAKMAFAGFTLEGRAYTGDMQPHRRRIADLLNLGPTFFLFETDDGPWIVNKDLLNHLVPMA